MVKNDQIVSSDTFSDISDIVYSRYVSKDFIEGEGFDNYEILSERGNYYLVKIKNYTLIENSIVYTNTESLSFLFEDLKQAKNLKNLILITHESDIPVTEKLYLSKPDCISKWFGINIFYENENLIPIPIGIPGKFTNFHEKSYDVESNLIDDKNNKIYINFRDNTNNKERSGLKSYFEKKDWAIVESGQINTDEYQGNLRKYTFNLCPIGNGFDTYRIWETLVAGSIPVTKKHIAFKSFEKFPIIFLDELKVDNINILIKLSRDLIKRKLDFLDINYWEKMITSLKNFELEKSQVKIYQDQILFDKRKRIFTLKENTNSSLKKIKYFLIRYTYLRNYILFFKKRM